jgi:hypothetical protein
MAFTGQSDMLTPQILEDAVRGVFSGKKAFMGSILASSGAVAVRGTMPQGGASAIGKTIDVPYFGTIPGFVDNNDGDSASPQKIAQTSEQATIARASLAIETTRWAQGIGAVDPALGDPHDEAAAQVMEQAERKMDSIMIAKFAATALLRDVYSATLPVYLDHRQVVRARSKFGDEQDGVVAMAIHSMVEADLAEMLDANGRPLLVETVRQNAQGVDVVDKRFAGVPLLVSDSADLTGSTMGAVTGAGTTPPVATLTGTPLGPWNLVIDCILGGAHQTATYRFSTDGGNTWSATITTLAAAAAQPLVDTAVDSLVGKNGATGLSVAFAAGTFNADNTWTATANLAAKSLICQRGAGAFWYNAQAVAPQRDRDILKDSDLLASHLYHAAILYRRRRGGTRPGCVAIKHNVRNYVG